MSLRFSTQADAAFRGQRDYYHSTDLYQDLVAGLASHGLVPDRFELKIRDRIVTRPRLDFHQGQAAEGQPVAATAGVWIGDAPWTVQVIAGEEPITRRKPYDETPIWSRVTQEGRAFTAQGCEGVAAIEVVTAVGVLAHKTLLPPAAGTRWLLAQLTATRMLGDSELDWFRFEVVRQLGATMTQGTMADRDGVFGKMLFILK